MFVCEFAGTDEEMGLAHGRMLAGVLAPLRRALAESEYWRALRPGWLRRLGLLWCRLGHARALNRALATHPRATAYLQGASRSGGVSRRALTELLLLEILASDRSRVVRGMGCSSFVAECGGRAVIGKNLDYQYPVRPYQGILVKRPNTGLAYVALCPVVMLFGGHVCMNEAGLLVSYNYAYSRRGVYRGGLPVSVLVHEVITSCDCGEAARRFIEKRPYAVGNGASLLIHDQRGGCVVDVEGEMTGLSQATINTNHFTSQRLESLNLPETAVYRSFMGELAGVNALESSRTRLAKLADSALRARDLEDVYAALGEARSENPLNNVFQTGKFWGTISTVVAIPGEMLMYHFDDIRSRRAHRIPVGEILQTNEPAAAAVSTVHL